MRLLDLTATAHTDGHRIDLAWAYPKNAEFPGVRVVRRDDRHPQDPKVEDDGVVVAHGIGLTSASDRDLKGERTYYYTLIPFKNDPPDYEPDPHNRTSAMATAKYDFAGRMYGLLPAIYRRYDEENQQLRRFLDLPGAELDRLYSLAQAALRLTDPDLVDGRLLQLLAGWIGWRTDFGLPIDKQRNEIRFAPRLYQTIGGVPTLDATVTRVTDWPNRTKEFVHNVARSNRPERLNLWSSIRDGAGNWPAATLASVNFSYDGRPAAIHEADGSTSVFFHTERPHGWDIWTKRFAGGEWKASEPVVDRPGIDKHPATARQGDRVWLFWQAYDQNEWRIWFITRTDDKWSAPAVFGDTTAQRRLPAAVTDASGGVWLFWLENTAGSWHVRYNRHNGTDWQLSTAATLPLDAGADPRVEDDLFLLFHPTRTDRRLWLFWARQDPTAPNRWSIVYRIKTGLDPAVADWSQIRPLPKPGTGAYHDRQPAVLLAANGDIELFWSSTQTGGWAIQRNILAVDPLTWGANAPVAAADQYSRKGPLAMDTDAGTLLAFRSNESIPYESSVYKASHTLDNRYAGTTTVDIAAAAKGKLRDKFGDIQTYTYDTGTGAGGARTNDDRISRDTVGLFLSPTTDDPAEVTTAISRLAGVLADFLPATTRPVFSNETT